MDVLIAVLMFAAGIALLCGLVWLLVKLDAPWWFPWLLMASCSLGS